MSIKRGQTAEKRVRSSESCRTASKRLISAGRGQATVEAAFLLPVVALLMLMLTQPAIILYDRMVMCSAAAEGCRLLQTATGKTSSDALEAYVQRRLGAIPPVPLFHVHDPCSWEIRSTGAEGSEYVSVSITNKLKLLPLMRIDVMGFGNIDADGYFNLTVEVKARSRPAWVQGSPSTWIGSWK